VILVGVGLLPEEDVLLLQGCAEKHGLLVVYIVVLKSMINILWQLGPNSHNFLGRLVKFV
jgi:hypothetical protein